MRKLNAEPGEPSEGYVPAVIVDRHSLIDPMTKSRIQKLCRDIVHASAGVVRILTAFSWQPELPFGMAKDLSGRRAKGAVGRGTCLAIVAAARFVTAV